MNNWMRDARCRRPDVDRAIFYPTQSHPTRDDSVVTQGTYDAARKVCRGCTVREACLDYAMATEKVEADRFGMWGGLTSKERSALARGSRRALELAGKAS